MSIFRDNKNANDRYEALPSEKWWQRLFKWLYGAFYGRKPLQGKSENGLQTINSKEATMGKKKQSNNKFLAKMSGMISWFSRSKRQGEAIEMTCIENSEFNEAEINEAEKKVSDDALRTTKSMPSSSMSKAKEKEQENMAVNQKQLTQLELGDTTKFENVLANQKDLTKEDLVKLENVLLNQQYLTKEALTKLDFEHLTQSDLAYLTNVYLEEKYRNKTAEELGMAIVPRKGKYANITMNEVHQSMLSSSSVALEAYELVSGKKTKAPKNDFGRVNRFQSKLLDDGDPDYQNIGWVDEKVQCNRFNDSEKRVILVGGCLFNLLMFAKAQELGYQGWGSEEEDQVSSKERGRIALWNKVDIERVWEKYIRFLINPLSGMNKVSMFQKQESTSQFEKEKKALIDRMRDENVYIWVSKLEEGMQESILNEEEIVAFEKSCEERDYYVLSRFKLACAECWSALDEWNVWTNSQHTVYSKIYDELNQFTEKQNKLNSENNSIDEGALNEDGVLAWTKFIGFDDPSRKAAATSRYIAGSIRITNFQVSSQMKKDAAELGDFFEGRLKKIEAGIESTNKDLCEIKRRWAKCQEYWDKRKLHISQIKLLKKKSDEITALKRLLAQANVVDRGANDPQESVNEGNLNKTQAKITSNSIDLKENFTGPLRESSEKNGMTNGKEKQRKTYSDRFFSNIEELGDIKSQPLKKFAQIVDSVIYINPVQLSDIISWPFEELENSTNNINCHLKPGIEDNVDIIKPQFQQACDGLDKTHVDKLKLIKLKILNSIRIQTTAESQQEKNQQSELKRNLIDTLSKRIDEIKAQPSSGEDTHMTNTPKSTLV